MAENLSKKPSKSILKNSSSFDTPDTKLPAGNRPKAAKGSAKWDEMNIMATLHPPDKDYGHMKIDEPKTPYNYEGLGLDVDALDAETLAAKIRQAEHETPKALRESEGSDEDDDDTPEERAAKHDFEQKRKKHYNEFYAVKLARKLLEKEEDDEAADDVDQKLQKSQINKEINRTIAKNSATMERAKALHDTPCRPPMPSRVANAATSSNTSVGSICEEVCTEAGRSSAKSCAKSRRCGCLDAVRKIFCGGRCRLWRT